MMKKSQADTKQLSVSQRRQVENEVVFRQMNEKVQKSLKKLDKMAKEEGYEPDLPIDDMQLNFYCECADENCRQRIPLSLKKYQELHKNRRQFIVIPGHEVSAIERVIAKKRTYTEVEKTIAPPIGVSALNSTNINNS